MFLGRPDDRSVEKVNHVTILSLGVVNVALVGAIVGRLRLSIAVRPESDAQRHLILIAESKALHRRLPREHRRSCHHLAEHGDQAHNSELVNHASADAVGVCDLSGSGRESRSRTQWS
eukprot:SAG11_NODE_1052_length_6029_cov_4.823946_7_plen_118_part_00